jgi:hypothetical protein
MVFFGRKKVDIQTPIRQAPTQALRNIQTQISANSITPGATVSLGANAPNLPPNLSFLKDVDLVVPQTGKLNDAKLMYKNKDTNIRV